MENDPTIQTQPSPGSVISPTSSPSTPVAPESSQSQQEDSNAGLPPVQMPENEQPAPAVNNVPSQNLIINEDGFSWTGPEFALHDKSSSWYAKFVLSGLILGGLIYVLTRDAISSIVVAVAIIVLGFYSMRRPKDVSYVLNDYGMKIGPKSFVYEEFRSFTATIEGDYLTVTFLPFRRFATTSGLCYRGVDEEKIVDFLSDRLPMEKHKADLVDSFMARIRF